ncbi:unnamed protein product [Brugia timori]|uniref:Uncharacterized protein n=1 Tax=Brugia timori TaxID=42155 RepID=A0A3P7VZA6_9BILA|nr:unnamed protein product [Brugia timori]
MIKAASIDPSTSACLNSEAFFTSVNKQTRKNRLCEMSYGSGKSSNNREVPDFILFFPLQYITYYYKAGKEFNARSKVWKIILNIKYGENCPNCFFFFV